MFGRVIAHIRSIKRRNSVAAHCVVHSLVSLLPLYVLFCRLITNFRTAASGTELPQS